MILIVTYNLKGGANAYTPLYAALKKQGKSWWHYMPSTWLIDTDHPPNAVAETLREHLLPGDQIFVGHLQNGFGGWLPKPAWEWIRAHGLSSKPDVD